MKNLYKLDKHPEALKLSKLFGKLYRLGELKKKYEQNGNFSNLLNTLDKIDVLLERINKII